MNLRRVGERIRARRKEKGLTIDDLSRAVHITPKSVALIENGQAKIDLEIFVDICTCLDRTPNILLNDDYIASDHTKMEDAMNLVGIKALEDIWSQVSVEPSTVIKDTEEVRKKLEAMLEEYRQDNSLR